MNTSSAVRSVLSNAGIKQGDLAGPLGVGSVQAVSNKFRLNRWTASDLIKVAEVTGCKLAFVLPDGERVLISADPGQVPPEGCSEAAAGGGVTPTNTRK